MAKSLDGVLTKKANQKENWNTNHIEEMKKCLDPETGYLYFLRNYFFIQHPVKGKIKFEPYDYQLEMLEAYHKFKSVVIMLQRQGGKCFLYNTVVKIKHKITGEIQEIEVGKLFDIQKDKVID